ncbi:MAG: transglutaminaseTgpA domain-containing protein [Mariprofundaceae bacterium]
MRLHIVSPSLIEAERLTLAVLLSGVAALALSDFVSLFYWGIVVAAAALRLWHGTGFALSEMRASFIGWLGFFWVGLELFLGRAFLVAFTDFLLILALAVTVEEPTPRNHVHRLLVGLFLILAAAVLTDSVLYGLPLVAFLIFIWRAAQRLYGMQWAGGDLPLSAWRSDVAVLLLTASLMSALFVALPRFDFHAYLQPVQPRMATSGFSGMVELGDFARELDATVVMRVEPVDGKIPGFRRHMMGRYWRGVALGQYTGAGWRRSAERVQQQWQPAQAISLAGEVSESTVRAAVYREASDHAYVFIPDGMRSMAKASASIQMSEAGDIRFKRAPSRRLRLLMAVGDRSESHIVLRPPRHEEADATVVSEAVRNWAAEVSKDASSSKERLARLVRELKSWTYDLNVDIDSAHPVEHFVLQGRRGHCELFASALALAARSLGTPARVVNGYYGGEWNEVGGFYLLRQQHAHSWVEAWVDGHWQRFDPTPASRWALSGVRFPAFDQLWESVKLSWYRYVLEFQNADRNNLFATIMVWVKRYFIWMIAGVLLVMGGWLAIVRIWKVIRFYRPSTTCWPVLDRWLERRGMHRDIYQPLCALPRPRGVEARVWQQFIQAWEAQAYDNKVEIWSRHVLRRHLRALSAARW